MMELFGYSLNRYYTLYNIIYNYSINYNRLENSEWEAIWSIHYFLLLNFTKSCTFSGGLREIQWHTFQWFKNFLSLLLRHLQSSHVTLLGLFFPKGSSIVASHYSAHTSTLYTSTQTSTFYDYSVSREPQFII